MLMKLTSSFPRYLKACFVIFNLKPEKTANTYLNNLSKYLQFYPVFWSAFKQRKTQLTIL
jgi:hypothetical protein